jgi:hypothetical protein
MNYISINYIDFTRDKRRGFEQLKAALAAPPAAAPADPYLAIGGIEQGEAD